MISFKVSRWQLSAIWNAFPLPSLLLRKDLIVFGANNRFMQATLTEPENLARLADARPAVRGAHVRLGGGTPRRVTPVH